MPDGLSSGHFHGADGEIDRRAAATRNVTDLRRARQRARRVISDLEGDVQDYLDQRNIESLGRGDRQEQRINEAISRLAQVRLSQDLLTWLEGRRQQTMGRAVRAALSRVQTTLSDQFTDRDGPDFGPAEQSLNRVISQVDAGLLYDDDDSLAEEIGNDITRQLRIGLENNEPVRTQDPNKLSLGDRVHMVLNDGDDPRRKRSGISGLTKKTKAELIAHDSVQQGYTNAATQRYLQNGFRYVIYDAVCDFVTSDLCRRLGECDGPPVVIDLTRTPWLVPPNHPWCRSGVRPTLNRDGTDAVTEEDIADGFLGTIFSTEQYRPTVLDVDGQLNQTALQRVAEGGA
jgi:hypothetical protein